MKRLMQKTLSGIFAFAVLTASVPFAQYTPLSESIPITANAASDSESETVGQSGRTLHIGGVEGLPYKDVFANWFSVGTLCTLAPFYSPNEAKIFENYDEYILENYNLVFDEMDLKPDRLLDHEATLAGGSETEVKVSLDDASETLKFCEENGIPLFGSTFVWYSQTPSWFFREGFENSAPYVDKETMDQRLESFIKNTFAALEKEYPDLKITGYEVCKEVFVNDGGGIRPAENNYWMKVYGSDEYIFNAFQYARKYAPKGTKLYLSDYNTYFPAKTDDICAMAKKIADAGNLDGVGMEAILDAWQTSIEDFEEAICRFEYLGLDIALTEFCVYDHSESVDRLPLYRDVFRICMDHYEHINAVILDASFGCGHQTVTAPTIEELLDSQPEQNTAKVKVSLVDSETGEPIILNYQSNSPNALFRECDPGDGTIEKPSIVMLKSNPQIVEYPDLSSENDYTFHISLGRNENQIYSVLDADRIKRLDNDSNELVFRLKFTPTGDANNDGRLSLADIVQVQKWLLGGSDAKIANWKAADYNNDNVLNAHDLTMLKRDYFAKDIVSYVDPDTQVLFGSAMGIIKDGLKVYKGPDESYAVLDELPINMTVYERGYNIGNDVWAFIEYTGQNGWQYGWIKIVEDDGETPTIRMSAMVDKPVIYLYPEQQTDVHVELELTESELATTYPKYHNGWDVTAYPDGSLLNKADGTHHNYLFWDSVNCRTRFDFSEGFCVAGSDTEQFLKEKLTYMGMTESEMNEFIVYWLPRMEHNAYNLIAFQDEAYTNSAKLDITPKPDSVLRVFMAYVPLDDAVDIAPQQLEQFERNGFSVVEWGGTEIC